MITQQKLQELFVYHSETGLFTNKISRSYKSKMGQVSGFLDYQGYHYIKIEGRRYLRSRLAWLYMTGFFPKEIDHINRIRNDDRWSNLREASRSQNCSNKVAARKGRYRGVKKLSMQRWGAVIKVNQKDIFLGSFPIEEFAALAYDAASKKYFGEFARYNFPEKAHRDWLLP